MTTPTTAWLRVGPLAAALLAAGCRFAAAQDTGGVEAQNLHFSGFGTFGLVHSDAPGPTGFQRDVFQRSNAGGLRADVDTRLGLQANYHASSQIELVGQAVAASRGPYAPASDIVTMAYAAWRPNGDVTLRVGRLNTDYFLLGDYRNVGFAYTFVRPPTESYGYQPYVLDGADLTRAWHFDDVLWKLRGVAGRSRYVGDRPESLVELHPAYALVVSREDGNGLLLKASVSRLQLHTDAAAVAPLLDALRPIGALPVGSVATEARDIAALLSTDGAIVTYYSLGMSLDRGPWLGSFELSRADVRNNPYTSGWGIIGHRWGAFTGYAGASAVHTEQRRTPPQWEAALTPVIGAAAAAQAQQLGSFGFAAAALSDSNQRTLTLGVRWDVSQSTALKLQWDRVHVDAYGRRLWPGNAANAIRANILSATLDFVF